jgi:hypothetical protein
MSTRWESYCNTTTDLIQVEPQIDSFDTKRVVEGFTHVTDGVYTRGDVGYITALWRDGVTLGAAQATAAAVNADGEWHYDSTTDLLTVCTTGNPDTVHRYQAGRAWSDVKSEAVARASEFVRVYLNKPILKRVGTGVQGDSLREWDDVIIQSAAYLACSYLIEPYDAEKAAALRLRAYNSEFGVSTVNSGLLDMIKRGDIALWNEVSRAYNSGAVREVNQDISSTGAIIDTIGTAATVFDLVKVLITTGGTISEGSASTVVFSVYTGSSTGLKTTLAQSGVVIDGSYQYLAHGIYGRFSVGKYTVSDEWEIEVRGSDPEAGVKAKSIELRRL